MESPQAQCSLCAQVARYTCPRCTRKTCSLTCSKSHKARFSCSGIRDKSAYVPLSKYGWGQLMTDYGYLEEVGREVEKGKKGREEGRGEGGNGKGAKGRRELVRRAADSGVELILLPDGMERRKRNKTAWLHKQKQLSWTVELAFPPSMSSQILPTVSSSTLLPEMLRFKRLRLPPSLLTASPTFVVPVDPLSPSSSRPRTVHVLPSTGTLGEALKGLKVLEWPKVEVWEEEKWEEEVLLGRAVVMPRRDEKPAPIRGLKRPREDEEVGDKVPADLQQVLDGYGEETSSDEDSSGDEGADVMGTGVEHAAVRRVATGESEGGAQQMDGGTEDRASRGSTGIGGLVEYASSDEDADSEVEKALLVASPQGVPEETDAIPTHA